MRACLHCVLIGKIDMLKPATPVEAILCLLAGHHQLARAAFSEVISGLCGPPQDLNHNAMLSIRNMQKSAKRPKRKSPARIKVNFPFIDRIPQSSHAMNSSLSAMRLNQDHPKVFEGARLGKITRRKYLTKHFALEAHRRDRDLRLAS